ncbi:MAG: DUF4143 domain-containing protein [Eggerthellaceae bacterium]|jgi:predicted AAA+ superfamily ATPase|nr:DUF4143 domain-containing protein [Eggerthellaceae bacterium]MDR2715742.1 DUF4143 domain-containing protein [Coriobacteriaceae bacterium]
MDSVGYLKRIQEEKLESFLKGLPAFSLEGAKGVGKTTLAKRYAQTVFRMDDETTASLIAGTPAILQEAAKPVLIDEWQTVPSIWNTVRHFVDDDMSPGQFILAGSAVPKKAKLHSGSGRIVRIRMRPLSLAERQMSQPLVSLAELLSGDICVRPQTVEVSQQEYVREILKSGFPGVRGIPDALREEVLNGYIDNTVEREFAELGIEVRRPETLRSWLKAYAAAEGSTTSYESILNAATPGQDKKPSKVTTMVYRDTLAALWILDPVAPWLSEGNLYANLGKSPKHYLVDPGLTARLLDITEQRLLDARGNVHVLGNQAKTVLGRLFEGLVAQSLKVYADANSTEVRHLRTSRGDHEIDFIVEKGDTLVAIEVKFSPHVSNDDTKQLNWFESFVPDRKVMKVVVYTGEYLVKRDSDDVVLIPAACLGA